MNAPIDVSGVELYTDRLTLRSWWQSDLEDFFEYASVDRVGQIAGWLPHKDFQQTQKILDSFIEKRKPSPWTARGRSSVLWVWNIMTRRSLLSWICCEPVPLALCFPRTTGEKA